MTFTPDIVISETDAMVLRSLVRRDEPNRYVLDFLDQEIARAAVLPINSIGAQVARLGTLVTAIKYPANDTVHGVLVIDSGAASIPAKQLPMTSMEGAALIGLHVGQSIEYYDRDDKLCCLELVAVASLDADDGLPASSRKPGSRLGRLFRLLASLARKTGLRRHRASCAPHYHPWRHWQLQWRH